MESKQTFIYEIDLITHKAEKINIDAFDLSTSKNIFWIHCNLNNQNDFESLSKKLNLPTKLVAFCNDKEERFRLFETPESLSIQIQCLVKDNLISSDKTSVGNLLIHLTKNYCFTASSDELGSIDKLIENLDDIIHYAETPCFVLFLLFDNTINEFSDYLYEFQLLTENIELSGSDTLYSDIINRKKQVMKFKQHMVSILHILMHLSSRKINIVSAECQKSLSNLLDNIRIVIDESESVCKIFEGKLAQIDNQLMGRVSHTMRLLAAFNAIFLPLFSVIAIFHGSYGYRIPDIYWKHAYVYGIPILVALVITVGLYRYFNKNKR